MATPNNAFFEKYAKVLTNSCNLADNGQCQIWGGGKEFRRDYCIGFTNVTFPDGRCQKINVARLAKIINLKNLEISPYLDASHICHNSLCTNPDHINLEKRAVNNERKICVSTNHCIHHGNHPDCLLNLKML